tara:strand:+ start:4100 stop:6361 length:2262 start_codon:yes stop_codon:yes gene_type:complete
MSLETSSPPLTLTQEKKRTPECELQAVRIETESTRFNQGSPHFNNRRPERVSTIYYDEERNERRIYGCCNSRNGGIYPRMSLTTSSSAQNIQACRFNEDHNIFIYEKLRASPWKTIFRDSLRDAEQAEERSGISRTQPEKAKYIVENIKKSSISNSLDIQSIEKLWESIYDCHGEERNHKIKEKENESYYIIKWLKHLRLLGLGFKYLDFCEKPGDFRLLKSTGQEAQTHQLIKNGLVNQKNIKLFKETVIALRKHISYKIITDENISKICFDPYNTYSNPDFIEKPIDPEPLFEKLMTSTYKNRNDFKEENNDALEQNSLDVNKIYEEIGNSNGTEKFKSIFCSRNTSGYFSCSSSNEEISKKKESVFSVKSITHLYEISYSFFIVSVLLCLPVLDFLDFLENKDSIISIIELSFDIIPFFQYIFGTCYFRTPQFRYFLRKKYEARFFSKLNMKITSILYLSSIYGLLLYGLSMYFYYQANLFKIIVGSLYGMFSAAIIVNNAIVFNIVFQDQNKTFDKIRQQIRIGYNMNFHEKPPNKEKKCCSTLSTLCCQTNPVSKCEETPTPLEINDLIIKVNEARYGLEKDIRAFNNIYVSCATSGFLGTIFLIAMIINRQKRNMVIFEHIEDEIHLILTSGIWFILFIVFTYKALSINASRYKLIDYLRTPFYTRLYLSRHKIKTSGYSFNQIVTNKNKWLIENESVTSLEWGILTDVLNSEWYEFNFFGFNIVPQLAKIGVSVVASLVVALLATL